MVDLLVNGRRHTLDVSADANLLWVLRERLQLNGAKYGCGIAACGACTVLLEGEPIRACVTPVGAVEGRRIVTIEGLGGDHPVQLAWVAEEVPQCGFCQAGQVLAAVALLEKNPRPGEREINHAFRGHLCRCGTYPRIRRAVRRAAEWMVEPSRAARK
jgi:aerobic-type carbon monoxide dehydrogenase small subunit (CoxS/CutS family)